MEAPQLIPPEAVSALAFMAAAALCSVRAMPWRLRLSLTLPILYFAAEYLYFSIIPISAEIRTLFTRIGLLLIFGSIVFNAALINWKWRREQRKHHANITKPS